MSLWSGAVFSILWLFITIPLYVTGTVLFWMYRTTQPIKARGPALVVLLDVVLIIWTFVLGTHRILVLQYPCWLALWAGYIGLTSLCNIYIIRCFQLFIKFNLTQLILTIDELTHKFPDQPRPYPKWVRYAKTLMEPRRLVTITVAVTLFLLLPAVLITIFDENVRVIKGDSCVRTIGDSLLFTYVVMYGVVMGVLAHKLREVVDGFRIREELRENISMLFVAGLIWFMFNVIPSLEEFNNRVFPVSTGFVCVTIFYSIASSTFWPLYMSIKSPPQVGIPAPEEIKSFNGLLVSKVGRASFKEFLIAELSVEYLLFWEDARLYRKLCIECAEAPAAEKRKRLSKALVKSHQIYARYLTSEALLQVRLPLDIAEELSRFLEETVHVKLGMEWEFVNQYDNNAQLEETLELYYERNLSSYMESIDEEHVGEISTAFDKSVHSVYTLMKREYYPRYLRSYQWRKLLKTSELYTEMNII